MARRAAKPLSEIHGEAYLAAIRQLVAAAQAGRSDTAFAVAVNSEVKEEVFTRDIVRSLRAFGLPGGIAKTDEPLRNYLHCLAPFLPYAEQELREIARGKMPDLSRLAEGKRQKNKPLVRLCCDLKCDEVSSDTIEDTSVTYSGDHLSDKQVSRLSNLMVASLQLHGSQYGNNPVKLALALGCIEGGDYGFTRNALKAALRGNIRGDSGFTIYPGDWDAIACICFEVEAWDGNTPILRENGRTYEGRVDELKASLSLNGSPHLV